MENQSLSQAALPIIPVPETKRGDILKSPARGFFMFVLLFFQALAWVNKKLRFDLKS
jgi:hypothetical protein